MKMKSSKAKFWVIQRIDKLASGEYQIQHCNKAKHLHKEGDAAAVEARRLAIENPGIEFVLMKSCTTYRTKPPEIEILEHK